MPAFVHEHARRSKAKFGYYHISLYGRIPERKNEDGVFEPDLGEAGVVHWFTGSLVHWFFHSLVYLTVY
jgi:hypothetical protein